MKKIVYTLCKVRYVLPTIVVAAMIFCSASAYEMPVYEAEISQEKPSDTKQENLTTDTKKVEQVKQAVKKAKGNFQLEDGLYLGSGTGYGGTISVAVEIKEKAICQIFIMSADGEDEQFFNRAKGVIDRIIESQAVEVDVVSGATFSSKGIMAAVKNALTGEVTKAEKTVNTKQQKNTTLEKVEENSTYKDGTYEGTGTGFGGSIRVKVEIKDGEIKNISVVEAQGEGSSYLSRAKSLLQNIVAKQTTNVDAVSGATFTSKGLIEAVRNALAKAVVSKQNNEKSDDSQKEKTSSTDKQAATGKLPYKDGVYYGTGEGFKGDITVAIIIQDKALKAAVITEAEDDSAFLEKAGRILSDVVTVQGTKVDTVSGATFSSKGIIEAVKNALKAAKAATKGKGSSDSNHNTTANPTVRPTVQPTVMPAGSPGNEEGTGNGTTYKNGTYTVTAMCYPDDDEDFYEYTCSVKVTIQDDKIIDITEIKGVGTDYSKSNDYYLSRASNGTSKLIGVVTQIINGTDLEKVDVVSGATCSSYAIIDACKKALETAKQ